MKSYPLSFVLFCLAVVGGLGMADARGWLLSGVSNSAQKDRTFASHYHK